MSWCNTKSEIPDDKDFYDIVSAFVFNCPSAKKLGSESKKNVHYESISVRTENGFKSRGINRDLLTTILVQIKKSLDFYRALKSQAKMWKILQRKFFAIMILKIRTLLCF